MSKYPKLFIPGPTHVPSSIMDVFSTPQIGHRTEEISELINADPSLGKQISVFKNENKHVEIRND